MIEIDTTRWKQPPPFDHQVIGVKKLIANKAFALFDEMGAAKTRQVIDAACTLFDAGEIEVIFVVCPAGVKSVWADRENGQIKRYAWVPSQVVNLRAKNKKISVTKDELTWIVVSYEFMRRGAYLKVIVEFLKRYRVWTVLDESSYIKYWKSQQTQACFDIGAVSERRTILNGTPIANTPLDLYSQFLFLDQNIIGCQNYYHFRARYARMGGWENKQVVGFYDLDQLNKKTAPYLLRRLKKECLDLPEKIGGLESETPNVIEVPLSAETWRIYTEMRRDMVAYLGDRTAIANVAAVKGLRLTQITAGFIGGLVQTVDGEIDTSDLPEFVQPSLFTDLANGKKEPPRAIGTEKLDAVIEWILSRGIERALTWCRFRAELERFYDVLRNHKDFAGWKILKLYGAQSKAERRQAEVEGEFGTGKAIILGQPQAGGLGLTLTSINNVLYASNDHNLKTRLQSEDRCHRPGQRNPVTYVDFLAVGPKGQKTVDHLVMKNLRNKQSVASLTTQQWKQELALLEQEEEQ